MRQITWVVPAHISGFGVAVAMLALSANTVEETRQLPLVTSLHVNGGRVGGLSGAWPATTPEPVLPRWVEVMREYGTAQVMLLTAPPPPAGEVEDTAAKVVQHLHGENLPAWVGALLGGQLPAALRRVRVTEGHSPDDVLYDPTAPTGSVEAWAQMTFPMQRGSAPPGDDVPG